LPPASWYTLVAALPGGIPWNAGTGLHLLAKEQLFFGLVEAFTHAANSYSLPSRLKPVPACQGITPWQAGKSLSQLANELSLGKKVPAGTCSPRKGFLAGWYDLLKCQSQHCLIHID
jgi:hypothetical protein